MKLKMWRVQVQTLDEYEVEAVSKDDAIEYIRVTHAVKPHSIMEAYEK